ncbi:flagellar motor switch protein FliN [Alkalilimnicola ehrlichii]|uniref:Flagellar motor switch protein FliN n=1 Tax=Alkalilimnicola ehrlichii TaxID=351052 RepID=A0A3E0WS71_9GAMM|nr:flagellar motor switch protein FliN [Alkalilimnicola ehrlichii]RFA28536.1 flagellar motor switch protein FliN [Alkalilimnicola ehrlichii]RFA35698.1 flagellar motor switch protein FliN [Alkalilimnicola ehrlichii]
MSDEDTNKVDAAASEDWAEAMAEQEDTSATGEQTAGPEESVQNAEMQDFSGDPDIEGLEDEDINLDVILDIPVTLSMEIGRTRVSIRNLLQLNQGSVVELDRLAGEPLDVMVNGTLVAHGEVVVVNERFGIRLTDVVSPAERVKKLR